MKQALVSILIPCYNAERWIRQCIQSALDQTYPLKEVIVVDDGSTDASASILGSFGDRIRFQQSSHSGGNATRNQLTYLACGEWLQYLDADDYLMPNKISSQLEPIGSGESDVAVIYSPVIIHNEQQPEADHVAVITENSETLTFIRWGALNTGGLLIKRDAILKIGGWKEDQPVCQEHELLLRLMTAGSRFLFHDKAEVVYRQHSSATVSRRNPLLTIRTRMDLTDRMEEHLRSSGNLTPGHREALFAARMECARSAYCMNRPFAEELCVRAEAHGRRWVSGSTALPLHYQLVFRTAGFKFAERFAELVRRRKVIAP